MERLSNRGLLTIMAGALITSSLMVQLVSHILDLIVKI